jgi:DNA polymerase-1
MFYFGVNLYNIWDTCVAEKCIKNGIKFDEDGQVTSAGLQYVANKYLGIYLSKEERGNIRFSGVNNPEVLKYAARDVWKLESIMYAQQKEIASKGIGKWVKLEMKFTPVLTRMVANGIYLNWDKWLEKVKSREISLKKSLEDLNTLANVTPELEKLKPTQYDLFQPISLKILWTSSKQVIPVMQALGVDTKVKDKSTGKPKDSVEAKHLEKFKSLHPLIAKYTDYKELEKEISTYGYSWDQHINKVTGRIHTSFNQIVDTTRLSSGDTKNGKKGFPNLQNLPSDKETRGCFTSQYEDTWINSCDYSSQESVYAAEVTQDPTLLAIVNDGLDMHSITATAISKILTGTHQEVTKDNGIKDKKGVKLRDTAKTVNFGIQYLVQANTLSQNLQCPREEAQKIIDATVKQFQGRHDFYEKVFLESIQQGFIYINKQIKSKYYLQDWEFLKYVITTYKGYYAKQKFFFQEEVPYDDLRKFESAVSVIKRSCANFPIQGTSSHITKLAMIYFDEWLTKEDLHSKCKIINTAHDKFCCV